MKVERTQLSNEVIRNPRGSLVWYGPGQYVISYDNGVNAVLQKEGTSIGLAPSYSLLKPIGISHPPDYVTLSYPRDPTPHHVPSSALVLARP